MNEEAIEKIAGQFMVQCQKGEPFECPYLETCQHEDKDICQWQLDMAEETIELFKSLGYVQPKFSEDLEKAITEEAEKIIAGTLYGEMGIEGVRKTLVNFLSANRLVQLAEDQTLPEGFQAKACAKCKSQIEQETAQRIKDEFDAVFYQDTGETYGIGIDKLNEIWERFGVK